MEQQWVRLRDPSGGFWDSALGFGLSRDEIKQLPETVPAGSLTQRWLNQGGLVPCERPVGAPHASPFAESAARSADPADGGAVGATHESPLPPTPDNLVQVAEEVIDRRIEKLQEDNTAAQLRAMADKMGLRVLPKAPKKHIATKIAVAEWDREHEEKRD